MNEDLKVALIAVAVAAVIGSITFAIWRDLRARSRKDEFEDPPEAVTIATIDEVIRYTRVGSLCMVMLVLTNIFGVLWFALGRTGGLYVLWAVLWVGANALWSLGCALGRRRTYRILQEPSFDPTMQGSDYA